MKIISEFKDFAVKGDVMDLAVAVVIGGAFGKIVTSLVADIVMPLLGVLMGGINFTNFKINLSQTVTMNIGIFIQAVVDFIIIAVAVFLMIKFLNQVKQKAKQTVSTLNASQQDGLLTEIKELLKKSKSKK